MSSEDSVDLARLVAESDCRQLVLRAASMTDRGEHEKFVGLFTEDAELSRPGAEPLVGRDAILASYRARPVGRVTKHLILGSLFDAFRPDRATAVSQVLLWSGDVGDSPGPFGRPAKGRQVVGEFSDEFAKTADGWRISRRSAHFDLFYQFTEQKNLGG